MTEGRKAASLIARPPGAGRAGTASKVSQAIRLGPAPD
jgi:hypothetical protein